MSETVTSENVVSHVQKLYNFVGALARNHNKIVEHLTDIHKNVKVLHENVKSLKSTIDSSGAPLSGAPLSGAPLSPSVKK